MKIQDTSFVSAICQTRMITVRSLPGTVCANALNIDAEPVLIIHGRQSDSVERSGNRGAVGGNRQGNSMDYRSD